MSRRYPRKKNKYLLWKDIPKEQRVDYDFLKTRSGASDPSWLARKESLLQKPGCPAAVKWIGTKLYMPCSNRPCRRDGFCWVHSKKKLKWSRTKRRWL